MATPPLLTLSLDDLSKPGALALAGAVLGLSTPIWVRIVPCSSRRMIDTSRSSERLVAAKNNTMSTRSEAMSWCSGASLRQVGSYCGPQ